MRLPLIVVLVLAPVFWAFPAAAHSYSRSDIKVGHVWALPSAGPGAQVFMPLYNGGDAADRLAHAETGRARAVVFRDEGGETVDGFALPPGRPLAMRPGRRALVLKGLAAPLKIGQRFEMTLKFQRAGAVTVTVWVEDAPSD